MLQHVSLEIRPGDVEAMLDFWELLGFRRVEVPETLRGVTSWVERDGTQIHLLYSEAPTVPPSGHAAVVVSDFDQALERLAASGREVHERRRHWGARRAFATAPGGHRVELMEAPPPASRSS